MDISPFLELSALASIGLFSAVLFALWRRQKLKVTESAHQENALVDSQIDTLSGLPAQAKFNRDASTLISRAKTPVGIILLKMDQFEDINNTYGSAIGDAVIRSLGDLIVQISRPGSISGRMTGVTFCIAIPNASLPAARIFAEGLRRAISMLEIASLPGEYQLTASFGVALHTPTDTFEQSYERAFEALLAAQKDGCNKISLDMKDAA